METKHKLYFGCAITGLPLEYVKGMILLRDSFKDHFEVLEFSDNCRCGGSYLHDIYHCVAGCDLMIAIVDERSTCLGWEMATMVEKHRKPTLAMVHDESLSCTNKFLLDISWYNPIFELKKYHNATEILPILLDFEGRHLIKMP